MQLLNAVSAVAVLFLNCKILVRYMCVHSTVDQITCVCTLLQIRARACTANRWTSRTEGGTLPKSVARPPARGRAGPGRPATAGYGGHRLPPAVGDVIKLRAS